MKELKCKYCSENFFVNDSKENDVLVCPFCKNEWYHPVEIVVTSFETAICKLINDYGVTILSDAKRFFAYFSDIAYEFQKEKRILTKSCDETIMKRFFELSAVPESEAKTDLKKIEHYLIEEEGVSEIWASKICNAFYYAIFRHTPDDNNPTLKYAKSDSDILSDNKTEKKDEELAGYSDVEIIDLDKNLSDSVKSTFGALKRFFIVNEKQLSEQKSFTLPDDVKMVFLNRVRIIPKRAFVNCEGLNILCISSNVIDISKDSFVNCPDIKYVIFIGENKHCEIHEQELVSYQKQVFCSVNNHHLRGKYSRFRCYDYGSSMQEKTDINKLIKFCKTI